MTTDAEPGSKASETRKRLKLVAAVLATGVAIEIATVVAENRNPSGFLANALVVVEMAVCVFVIAATIEVAEERSPRTLFLVSLAITATPFASAAILSPFMSSGHGSPTFAFIYFTLACVISGVPLMIVAGVRFIIEQRKQRSNARE
jgi:surface polysaccharide O-acyltransferase-like enzyme